ncbi:uncharacterized protein Z519_10144 [Cladophialophora bantiana CBS 173.52]|uniref:Uncharacterized protein n=1 Tax=Cladophialophora bantiana (strain ATCC 10958 / CBS 173.52 / CDC B-1940 / NIH 8579) TaxID=1442370 RepID=A0A0D2EGW5_CLAB1|nr:uncharacterized protein Z519_10144 [Cladophialophora bantiana CBS 173.52]KIW89291.1 hypothetical protein Z519_10144 [Cladophialophora bantiana CBS 173.52]
MNGAPLIGYIGGGSARLDGRKIVRRGVYEEILLSKEYILNDGGGGEIKLSDLGTIASLLFRTHSGKEWLGELASWCRRIFRLRAYYFNYTLCPSNVLQLTTSLDATLPCDKCSALCGVLRLKSIQYQNTHTEHEALQNILVALTVEGRFSWRCAIPPSPPGHANRLVLDGPLLPYIENQLDLHATFYGQPEVSQSTVSFSCYHVGHVKETAPLAERIQEAAKYAPDMSSTSATDIPRHIAVIQALLLRICGDAILPLVTEPILSRLCNVFHPPVKDAGSTVLMKLLTLRDPSSLYTRHERSTTTSTRSKQDLDFIAWTPFPPNKDKTGNGTTDHYAIGTKGSTTTGMQTDVFSIRQYPLLFAATPVRGRVPEHDDEPGTNSSSLRCVWQTVLHQPVNKETRFTMAAGTAILLRPFGARRQRWSKYRLTLQLEQAQCTSGGGGGDTGESRGRAPAVAITLFVSLSPPPPPSPSSIQ